MKLMVRQASQAVPCAEVAGADVLEPNELLSCFFACSQPNLGSHNIGTFDKYLVKMQTYKLKNVPSEII